MLLSGMGRFWGNSGRLDEGGRNVKEKGKCLRAENRRE